MAKISRILQSPWVVAMIGGVLFWVSFAYTIGSALDPKPKHVEETVSETTEPVRTIGPSWKFHNPEIDLMVMELKEARAAHDEREKELRLLEARLRSEREELKRIRAEVQDLRDRFDAELIRIEEDEQTNLIRLAKLYGKMDPEAAVDIIQSFEDRNIVKVLVFMPDKQAAILLQTLAGLGKDQARRAAKITDHLRLTSTIKKDANT